MFRSAGVFGSFNLLIDLQHDGYLHVSAEADEQPQPANVDDDLVVAPSVRALNCSDKIDRSQTFDPYDVATNETGDETHEDAGNAEGFSEVGTLHAKGR